MPTEPCSRCPAFVEYCGVMSRGPGFDALHAGTASASEDVEVRSLVDAAVAGTVAKCLAQEAGFGRRAATEIGIVASELATNAFRHAGGGTIGLRVDGEVFETRCDDRGRGEPAALIARARWAGGLVPGEAAPIACGGGLGHGLGAVARLSDTLDIEARPGGGVRVCASRRRTR